MLEHKFEPNVASVQRLEVFSGTGRRRRWTSDDKARIVDETLEPGAVVSEVARRHGISAQQLFGWRRAARRCAAGGAREQFGGFARVMLDGPPGKPAPSVGAAEGAVLEIIVGAMVARIPVRVDGATLSRIVRALKGAS